MEKKLMCGAARRCITPPAELMPRLYGLKKQSFGGVVDDLYLRVMALKSGETTLLFVSFDLDKAPYPQTWMEALSERFGVPEENISYSATHTHSAPLTDVRPFDGPNKRRDKTPEQQKATGEYEKLLFDILMSAAVEAFASMKQAKFGYACTNSYVNANRNVDYPTKDGGVACELGINGEADVDRTLFVGKFEDESGITIAYFMNYAVHNCVMHGNTMFEGKLGISADLGGNISKLLERQEPGSVALWTSGAAGDVNPVLMNEIYFPSIADGCFTSEMLQGDQLLFLRVMMGRHYADVKSAIGKITCDRPDVELASSVKWIETPGRQVPGEEVEGAEDPAYQIRMQGIRIGDVGICAVSGELYTSLGRMIRENSPFERTLIINHNACQMVNSQYIFDDDGIARKALGYEHSFIRPGHVAPALKTAAAELLGELKS